MNTKSKHEQTAVADHLSKRKKSQKKKKTVSFYTQQRQGVQKRSRIKRMGSGLRSNMTQQEVMGLFFLLLTALLLFLHFGTDRVSGNSMAPTFRSGDRLIRVKSRQIKRYDVITFKPQNVAEKSSYVKRIIGLPGDEIQLADKTLLLLAQNESEQNRLSNAKGDGLPDGTTVITLSDYAAHTLAGMTRIPADHYFVEGDNRQHSDDSRVFGLIEAGQIEGVVRYRYYPFTKMGIVH